MVNPVLAEVWRGSEIESRHRGRVLALDRNGETLLSLGDIEELVFPRSAIKPMQALPLVNSGAVDALGLSAAHIAFACASHNGEALHTSLAHEILDKLQLKTDILACGAEYPMFTPAAYELVRQQLTPDKSHHNCSGKHCGMLALSKYQGWPVANYHHYNHPVQRAWRDTLSELCQLDAEQLPWEWDGCGLPALALPLKNLAIGFQAFAAPELRAPQWSAAILRIHQAIAQYPMNIAGSERACTDIIKSSQGRVIVKVGAEGVYAGVIPERGIGFVLKMDDGSRRAAETALGGLLTALGEPVAMAAETQKYFRRQLSNSQGKTVGHIVPTDFNSAAST